MKKQFFFAAVALVALASCSSEEIIGDSPTPNPNGNEAINFSFNLQNTTRGGDIAGPDAAEILNGHFYVTGTKGTEAETSPTPTLVFDNYLVHYGVNTANMTESNTANWEYVGVTPGESPYANYQKLGSAYAQTIKYWDYNTAQYDFLAFSTGSFKAMKDKTTPADNEIGVTAMKYGTALAGATAYTFYLPSVAALRSAYITDITEVPQTSYGNEVTLKFKNLGSKVRVALYETVPGYAVRDVLFYQVDGTTDFSGTKNGTAKLICAEGLPIKGSIAVSFPYIGTNNHGAAAYDKATATVEAATTEGTETFQTYGTLSNFATIPEGNEPADDGADTPTPYNYIGRTLPTATFAGSLDDKYYTTVFPVSENHALTLRVDYTLVSTDGSNETITVHGAKAVVPATYTKWQPNYAYTYIFKISDNTNGWTASTVGTTPAGLFPITFDAVVAEATDANAEQTTITTVSAPTITTYQQGHKYTTNEYSKTAVAPLTTARDIYVQVMNNSGSSAASLVSTLSATNSVIYELSDANATEAKVMDALTMRTTAVSVDNIKGRNGLELTKGTVDNTVESIVNGVDDKPITVASGSAGKIAISGLTANKSYAYVYMSTVPTSEGEVKQYEPITVTSGSAIGTSSSETFYKLAVSTVAGGTVLTAAEAPADGSLYFAVAEDGSGNKTYSYVSPLGKATIPAGYVKVAKSSLTSVAGNTNAEDGYFYFDMFITNNGAYAVKVIKIVA